MYGLPNVIVNTEYGALIVNVHDYPISTDIFQIGYHLKHDIKIMCSIVSKLLSERSSLELYDIGANIGLHTLAFSSISKENIQITAFEAQRLIFYMLCGSVAINNLRKVRCLNKAVSNEGDSFITISTPNYCKPANFGSFELIPPMRSDNQSMEKIDTENVDTVRLDDLINKVDFIKIDVEGMEDKVLSGGLETIRRYRPVCIVELGKTNYEYVLGVFSSLNYLGLHKGADLIAIPIEQQFTIDGLTRFF